ncbi:MAG: hypothetical protein HeimC3_37910 [Candidatus Heimdallarchaeota archaeon LC_3]|nr:MAG: hypothetical protein HeimC3_50480 [Candidatus Heimdallarchaeota archaeon LC_3]OLS21042.1 MAG: hypothetical protein HeimC3_37910 [Candidatus Heimdallarchaeota archaeon LC_3]
MTETFKEKWKNAQFLFKERQYGFANKILEEIKNSNEFRRQSIDLQGEILLLHAKIKRNSGENEQAGLILKDILELLISQPIRGQVLRLLGALAFSNGELEAAIHYISKESEIWIKENNKSEYASCMYYLGEIYRFMGKFDESKGFHQKGLKYRENHKETENEKKDLVASLNGLAHLHRSLNLDNDAEELYTKILDIDKANGFHLEVLLDYYNLILLSLGKRIAEDTTYWVEEIKSYNSDQFEEIKETILKIINGHMERLQHHYNQAIRLFDSSTALLEDLPYMELLISVRLGIIESLVCALGTSDEEKSFTIDYVKESVLNEFYKILEKCGSNRYWTMALEILFVQIKYYQIIDPDYQRTLKTLREGIKLARDWDLPTYESEYREYLNELQSNSETYRNKQYDEHFEFTGSELELQRVFRNDFVPLIDLLRQKRNL